MKKLVHLVDTGLSWALIAAMASILLVVVWQVISRFILQDPASVTEELSRFILMWIGILGAAYAYRQKAHLGLNLVVERQAPHVKKFILLLIEVLVLIFSAVVLVFGGKGLVNLTLELEQISAALGVHIGFVYTVLPISGVLIIFYCIVNMMEILSGTQQEQS
ncbi:TRAP transporter small permease [Alteromonas sp. a30]|uniref:TRAP transporter small permease n=1 Tax=Alteromonas sp. a30 TaxID=2730917 RepID=UPI0022819C0C|nr:TRAP transporter small permease [Alteromonas sp. a30]MCY7297205.1 TRAP transporter small permease [Alteromonas sp. a30]